MVEQFFVRSNVQCEMPGRGTNSAKRRPWQRIGLRTLGLPTTGGGRPTHSSETIARFGHFSLTNSILRSRKNRAFPWMMIAGDDRRRQCRPALGGAGIGDNLRPENRQYLKWAKEHADETFSLTQLDAAEHTCLVCLPVLLCTLAKNTTENFVPRESPLRVIVGSRSWWQTKAASILLALAALGMLGNGQLSNKKPRFWQVLTPGFARRSSATGTYMLLSTGRNMVAILFWRHSVIPIKTDSIRAIDHWDALKSFILEHLKIKVAPYPIMILLDTLKEPVPMLSHKLLPEGAQVGVEDLVMAG